MGAPKASPTLDRQRPAVHGKCLADELCAEHKELAQQLSLFDAVANEVGAAPAPALRRDVDRAYELLTQRLLPHAQAEHDLRTRLAVHDHRRVRDEEDHGEVERLAGRLSVLRSQLTRGDDRSARREIRHILYELHALTRLHFADELLTPSARAEGR